MHFSYESNLWESVAEVCGLQLAPFASQMVTQRAGAHEKYRIRI